MRKGIQLLLCNQIPVRYLKLDFPHPVGIVIASEAIIEKPVVIYQNVTIGRQSLNESKYPTIKMNCIIYPGACVTGNITIGECSIVAANAIVNKDVPSNCMVFGYNIQRPLF